MTYQDKNVSTRGVKLTSRWVSAESSSMSSASLSLAFRVASRCPSSGSDRYSLCAQQGTTHLQDLGNVGNQFVTRRARLRCRDRLLRMRRTCGLRLLALACGYRSVHMSYLSWVKRGQPAEEPCLCALSASLAEAAPWPLRLPVPREKILSRIMFQI